MSIAIDHVLLFCSAGAPEGDALVRAGLREGSRNTHPGQGTANRRFFFQNAYLELLWVSDPAQAQSERTRPTHLWERWVGRGVDCCPLGIALRPDGAAVPPFATWAYHPEYLPAELSIEFAADTPLDEPEFFYLGFAQAPDAGRKERTDHAISLGAIQALRVGVRGGAPRSAAARAVEAAGIATFHEAETWSVEIVFDEAGRDVLDFRPQLPLALRF